GTKVAATSSTSTPKKSQPKPKPVQRPGAYGQVLRHGMTSYTAAKSACSEYTTLAETWTNKARALVDTYKNVNGAYAAASYVNSHAIPTNNAAAFHNATLRLARQRLLSL